jgi:hypothetical protein
VLWNAQFLSRYAQAKPFVVKALVAELESGRDVGSFISSVRWAFDSTSELETVLVECVERRGAASTDMWAAGSALGSAARLFDVLVRYGSPSDFLFRFDDIERQGLDAHKLTGAAKTMLPRIIQSDPVCFFTAKDFNYSAVGRVIEHAQADPASVRQEAARVIARSISNDKQLSVGARSLLDAFECRNEWTTFLSDEEADRASGDLYRRIATTDAARSLLEEWNAVAAGLSFTQQESLLSLAHEYGMKRGDDVLLMRYAELFGAVKGFDPHASATRIVDAVLRMEPLASTSLFTVGPAIARYAVPECAKRAFAQGALDSPRCVFREPAWIGAYLSVGGTAEEVMAIFLRAATSDQLDAMPRLDPTWYREVRAMRSPDNADGKRNADAILNRLLKYLPETTRTQARAQFFRLFVESSG